MASDTFYWNAIVLTCPSKGEADVLKSELDQRQKCGLLDERSLILTVEDPQEKVGSGGATLNALLVVAEHISAQQGFTVVNADVLHMSHILIMHTGRNFLLDPCGRAFVCLPLERKMSELDMPVCNIDMLLASVTDMAAKKAPPGVWVCSTDMLLHLTAIPDIPFDEADAFGVSVLGTKSYAKSHGVYKLNSQNMVEDIIYRGVDAAINACGIGDEDDQVPLVAGVVYFRVKVAEKLLSFHTMPPLDSCTYMGIDSGSKPTQLSLFFDILLAMCSDVTEESFISGERSLTYAKYNISKLDAMDLANQLYARRLIWKELKSFKLKVWPVPSGTHLYMSALPATHHKHLLQYLLPGQHSSVVTSNNAGSFAKPGAKVADSAILINSLVVDDVVIGNKTILSHCYIDTPVTIGKDSILNGVYTIGLQANETFADSIVLQTFHIRLAALPGRDHIPVTTVLGKYDDPQGNLEKRASSTICNMPFAVFFRLTGINSEDLWDSDMSDYDKTVSSARLFPVLHPGDEASGWWAELLLLQGQLTGPRRDQALARWRKSWRLSFEEILNYVHIETEFKWRKRLQHELISAAIIEDTLLYNQNRGLSKLYKGAVLDGYSHKVLNVLDKVASASSASAGVSARCLASAADLLGAMACGAGGLRSGPAANREWRDALSMLEAGDVVGGVAALAAVRGRWLDTPARLVRAARHYEGAAQILIRRAVMSARQFVCVRTPRESVVPARGAWVTAECPARLDLAGGWSDTPPITYEHGGAVTDVAITVDGQKPIGAKVRRIPEPHLVLSLEGGQTLTITELVQLEDYTQPQAPGALLKAAFLCADVVSCPSSIPLSRQLAGRYDGGFELHTWSNLPHGSGLGTSSILAGAVLAVLWRASGRVFDVDSLVHAVLQLEQMLTTGGGWQDQVGGLTPGIKLATSPAQLPLQVNISYYPIVKETVQEFSDRLLLVYTGKTRLARNLLQNVLRTWYARDPEIVATEDKLVETAHKCMTAFTEGNLAEVGACMNEYWSLKMRMAPGCEPQQVREMRAALHSSTHGTCMAGAGGGGFLYVLCKHPHSEFLLKSLLTDFEGVTIHTAAVDCDGLVLTVEGEGRIAVPLHTAEDAGDDEQTAQ